MLISLLVIGFNIIKVPYDKGANRQGSSFFPNELEKYITPEKSIRVDLKDELTEMFSDTFNKIKKSLEDDSFTVTVGGDHTVAIPSIFSSNEYCKKHNESLGILWLDAHVDFNTMETSPSKNLHGMPVAVLCGHTLPELQQGTFLCTSQFAFYGIRDLDTLEFNRFQRHDMQVLYTFYQIEEWLKKFDKIHISFDVDCLDPSIMSSVNTPVPNGIDFETMDYILKNVKKSGKLLSMDVVEFNPTINNNCISVVVDLLNSVL